MQRLDSVEQLCELLKDEADEHSQLGRDLSGTLWQLVHVKVEGDAALQAEEAAAVVALEDRLCRQIGRFAEEHQQVPVQKPGRRA